MRLIVHAPNVHQGGGRTLLLPLLARLAPGSAAILDERLIFEESLPRGVREWRVRATVAGRLKAERILGSIAETGDMVLCFGNLPPLFCVKGRVVVFLQNRYLLGESAARGFPWRARLRIAVERAWFARRIRRARSIVVQTPTMQRKVRAAVGVACQVLPFCASTAGYTRSVVRKEIERRIRYDFVYVATGEPHKNHGTLLEAWGLLAAEGLRPTLCLTVPEKPFPDLVAAIRQVSAEHDLRIENLETRPPEGLRELYGQARALVYPSLMESLGLPLMEARMAGLPIIAGELDYVRDVVDPEETFDPSSPVSLARAIKRFLGRSEPALPVLEPEQFLRRILSSE